MPLPADWVDGGPQYHAPDQNNVEIAVNALSAFASKTANYTLLATDRFIAADATAGEITMTLPSASAVAAGKQFVIEKVDPSVNPVLIATTSSQTINGAANYLLVFNGNRVGVVSNGSNWQIDLSNYAGAQLGYAELDAPFTFSNSSLGALTGFKVSGLSITTIGAGRPVKVSFNGQGYSTTANAFLVAQLLINGSATGGRGGATSSPSTTVYRSMAFEASPVLALGTSYTFEVGMWNQSGTTAVLYADLVTPAPVTFMVEGQ